MRSAGIRVLLLLLLPLLLLTFTGHEAAAAGNGTGRIVMDNQELALPQGVSLENVNGSVMIPIRVVVENLGFKVSWEQTTRKVTVQQDNKSVQLAVGSMTAQADGVALTLNAAPKQTGGTVLVPIRFVSEQFGLKVGWDNSDKTVYLTGGLPTPTPLPSPASSPQPTPTPSNAAGEGEGSLSGSATSTPSASPGTVQRPEIKGAVFSGNQLIIAASSGAKPVVSRMSSPDRIVIDFVGAAFAADFGNTAQGTGSLQTSGPSIIPQGKLDVTGYPLVSEIRYALFSNSPSTVRFVIQTVGNQPYTLSTDDSTGLITVDLNAVQGGIPATGGLNGKPVVVIDAGHGGSQPGAISLTGKQEKDLNLAVALKVGAILQQEQQVNVVFTRTTDITLGLQDRVNIAQAAQANVFVSIHANSLAENAANRSKINGSETYYTRSDSLPLAQIMHKHLVAGTGFKDNGVRSQSLHVTRETTMPAVLLELGYLTNAANEAALYTDAFQNKLAQEIAAGIKEFLGL
ncbi:N-acetylmuramoyl-L-alanine amidase [Paenibacillus sp. NFR01]|uniref:N-acetylmuramoyl-L-alanine amidase n=1 Tax=Paenibacillus sp. NFR01 TaxID=1566279 RepID=UPI0008BFE0CA|nr:N-acetylmuramoyl-L-alanine amidase [Paenibacillus sp. NFR01]SET50464.1 N-acetylmuramoyl-L-alanine amidase [Paenibacillus sp. NFR01]